MCIYTYTQDVHEGRNLYNVLTKYFLNIYNFNRAFSSINLYEQFYLFDLINILYEFLLLYNCDIHTFSNNSKFDK